MVSTSAHNKLPKTTFRLGVGGRWSAHDLEACLSLILQPMGWSVCSRDEDGDGAGTAQSHNPQTLGMLEILPLGDGLGHGAFCSDDEELDAVIISPLNCGFNNDSEDQVRKVRKHLARFVRQLKPGGATIFAADDPASDIFSSIRLDCQRLGYALTGVQGAYRIVRSDRPEPVNLSNFRLVGPEGDTDWPIPSETSDRWQLALAVLAAVDVLGVSSMSKALGLLSASFGAVAPSVA
jgi:hypothetical protein